jgi:hypothetical protein
VDPPSPSPPSPLSRQPLGLPQLVLAFIPVLLSASPHEAGPVTVVFPRSGPSAVRADLSSLQIATSAGAQLILVKYQIGSDPNPPLREPVRFRIVDTPEIGPLVIATAGTAGGSDSSFETSLVGEVDGSLRELLPTHLHTMIEDAVCLGHFGRANRLGVVVANFQWLSGPHLAPHEYDVSLFLWSGRDFRLVSRRRTARRYESVREALAELGFQCRYDFVLALLPELH